MSNLSDIINEKIIEDITAPLYTVKDLGISTRMLTYYEERGLLYQNDHLVNNKRTFSLVQGVWLKIAKELILFGFPSSQIGSTKELFEEMRGTYVSDKFLNRNVDSLTALVHEVIVNGIDFRILYHHEHFTIMNSSIDNLHDMDSSFYFDSAHLSIPLVSKIAPLWEMNNSETINVLKNFNSKLDKREHNILSALKGKDFISFHYKPPRGEKRNGILTTVERINPLDITSLPRYIHTLKHCSLNISFSNKAGKPVSIIKEQHTQIKE